MFALNRVCNIKNETELQLQINENISVINEGNWPPNTSNISETVVSPIVTEMLHCLT
jgi:hypothetical protein